MDLNSSMVQIGPAGKGGVKIIVNAKKKRRRKEEAAAKDCHNLQAIQVDVLLLLLGVGGQTCWVDRTKRNRCET